MSEYVVEIHNVCKWYYTEKPRTLKKWASQLFNPFERRIIFKDYSLNVKRGEILFIGGLNGSGKTTLLKLISRIIFPDSGSIKIIGNIVPLIELGSGFNFELSGLENIITNCAIFGLNQKQTQNVIPQILAFSELQSFIQVPVKRYSTGMMARLAFSIGIHSNPDILLLDEMFAVGDSQFRKKAENVIEYLHKQKKTIIITGHYENMVKKTRSITLTGSFRDNITT